MYIHAGFWKHCSEHSLLLQNLSAPALLAYLRAIPLVLCAALLELYNHLVDPNDFSISFMTANNDCSSFTACRRPILYGPSYISYFLYQVWLAHSIRHPFLHQSSLAYLGALKAASRILSLESFRALPAAYGRILTASVQAIVLQGSHWGRELTCAYCLIAPIQT